MEAAEEGQDTDRCRRWTRANSLSCFRQKSALDRSRRDVVHQGHKDAQVCVSQGEEVQMTRAKFKIRARTTEETFVRLRQGRGATGLIFLEVDGTCFPERDWDDFVLDLLASWSQNIVLFRYSVVELENSFMDGPFAFRIRRECEID